MKESPSDGAYCVSPIYGGVGYVDNGECVITMAMEPTSYYSDTNQYSDRASRDIFSAMYPAFNNYYEGDERRETEFHTLSSPCMDGLVWTSAADATLSDEATSVHLPATYSFWHESWWERWEMERSFLCRMKYENDKTCYGRFFNGTCNGYDNSYYGYENVEIEVLGLDDSNCPTPSQWSECSGEDGRPNNCGPGTQTRSSGESRSCLGTCEETFLFQTTYIHPDPEPEFQCTRPGYPTHYDYRQCFVKF